MAKSVIYLDDDKEWQTIVLEALACDDLSIDGVTNESEFWDFVEKSPPDAFVIDWFVPLGVDIAHTSQDLIAQVRSKFPGHPIIILTVDSAGSTLETDTVGWLADHDCRYIRKDIFSDCIDGIRDYLADPSDQVLLQRVIETLKVEQQRNIEILKAKEQRDQEKIARLERQLRRSAPVSDLTTRIESREIILETLLKGEPGHVPPVREDATLLVARRYNSWYPSYFDVDGGCYALITSSNEGGLSKCFVVDPGFSFLKPLRELGIEACDIDGAIVSHFHPDHMAGLLEYAALRKVMKKSTNLYLNPTCHQALSGLASDMVTIHKLTDGDRKDLVAAYKRKDGSFERVFLLPFKTFHEEIGQVQDSLGLRFMFETCPSKDFQREVTAVDLAILNDTSCEKGELDIVEHLHDAHVVVLHLGSLQEKSRHGKHLYIDGLERVLRALAAGIDKGNARADKLVLISEFGLEHAEESVFRKLTHYSGPDIFEPGFSPLLNLQHWADNYFGSGGDVVICDLGLEVRLMQHPDVLVEDNYLPPRQVRVEYDVESECHKYVRAPA